MTQRATPDFSLLLTPQEDFPNLVKCAVASKETQAPRIDLLFVRFNEDRPDEHGLAEVVYHQVVNYALPRRKIAELLSKCRPGAIDFSPHSKLLAEARRAFISYNSSTIDKEPKEKKTKRKKPPANTRYAEIGEVVAFCVASHFLSAGQVAAKMALKTNSEMPVFGLDGIHVRSEPDGSVTVFFLEAKMVGDAKSGAKQYSKSAGGFDKDRAHKLNEQRIARDLSNLDILESAARESAIEYFDPYSEKQANLRERFVGVIIYSEPAYCEKLPITDATPLNAHEENFAKNYQATHPGLCKDLNAALSKAGAEPGRCRAFFLAVPNVDHLKQLFAKEMTGEHIR
ncbi:MAG: DUF1837 domain-containing protein [Chthoniobacteraceae bacterium]